MTFRSSDYIVFPVTFRRPVLQGMKRCVFLSAKALYVCSIRRKISPQYPPEKQIWKKKKKKIIINQPMAPWLKISHRKIQMSRRLIIALQPSRSVSQNTATSLSLLLCIHGSTSVATWLSRVLLINQQRYCHSQSNSQLTQWNLLRLYKLHYCD